MDNITEKSATLRKLEEKFPEYVLDFHSNFGDDTAVIRREGITDVCLFLRDNPELSYNFLMDLTAVDYLGKNKTERFEVVYHFYSLKHNARLRLKAPVPEDDCAIDSVTSLWESANWAEREAWDLYGIKFRGHPELKRILLYEPFKGHPLRKDYPVKKRQPLIGPEN